MSPQYNWSDVCDAEVHITPYEAERLQNMAKNKAELAQLGPGSGGDALLPCRRTRAARSTTAVSQPSRRSRRIASTMGLEQWSQSDSVPQEPAAPGVADLLRVALSVLVASDLLVPAVHAVASGAMSAEEAAVGASRSRGTRASRRPPSQLQQAALAQTETVPGASLSHPLSHLQGASQCPLQSPGTTSAAALQHQLQVASGVLCGVCKVEVFDDDEYFECTSFAPNCQRQYHAKCVLTGLATCMPLTRSRCRSRGTPCGDAWPVRISVRCVCLPPRLSLARHFTAVASARLKPTNTTGV